MIARPTSARSYRTSSFGVMRSARTTAAAVYPTRTSPATEADSSFPSSPIEGPSWNSALVAPRGIQRPIAGNAGMTVYSTAVIQTSTPTTAAIWLRTRAPTATPIRLYAAMTTNTAPTTCQSGAAAVTLPSRERLSAMPTGTEGQRDGGEDHTGEGQRQPLRDENAGTARLDQVGRGGRAVAEFLR